MRKGRRDLVALLGGAPNAAQAVLIERAAALQLAIRRMDAKMLAGTFTDLDTRQYLAWVNTLTRLMRQIGASATVKRGRNALAAHLASQAGQP